MLVSIMLSQLRQVSARKIKFKSLYIFMGQVLIGASKDGVADAKEQVPLANFSCEAAMLQEAGADTKI